MNVQRFLAPTSREAMAKARSVFGDSAVILSSRSTGGGFEVVATAEENLDQLADQRPAPRQPAARETPAIGGRRSLQERAELQRPVLGNSQSSVEQTERDLKKLFPEAHWNQLHLRIIFYGREHCTARGCDGTVCELCRTLYPGQPFLEYS